MIPHTYAQWVATLDDLKNAVDDTTTLQDMQQGTLEWQTGVAERFSKKLVEAVNTRLTKAGDRFGRDMGRAHGEGDLVRAILALRRELSFLLQAVDLPVIPADLRGQYCALVRSQADTMQKSLEDSARKDRTGKLASIVRNHKVNAI